MSSTAPIRHTMHHLGSYASSATARLDSAHTLGLTRIRPSGLAVTKFREPTVTFPNLRPTSTAISVRLPETLLTELKLLANERDVPYQSLLKMYLADRVRTERR